MSQNALSGVHCPRCTSADVSTLPAGDGSVAGVCNSCGSSFTVSANAPPSTLQPPFQPSTAGPSAAYAPSAYEDAPLEPPVDLQPEHMSPRALAKLIASLVILLGLLLLFLANQSCLCASVEGGRSYALRQLQRCPRATQLLGEPIGAASFALPSCGNCQRYPGGGSSSDHITVSGSRARGSYRFSTRLERDRWSLNSATLRVGQVSVRVPQECFASEPRPTPGASVLDEVRRPGSP